DGWVVSELLIKGTNDGPYMGMPATRRSIQLRGVSLQRYNAEGLITDLSSYYDNLSMLAQLGLFPPPDPEANKALAIRADEHVNTGDPAIADEVFATDFINHDPANPDVRDLESYKGWVAATRTAMPDFHATMEDMIAEGDKVAERWTATGTQEGELPGIPPTGRQVTFTGMTIYRVAEGKIVEMWWSMDSLGLMQQLGVMPPTATDYTWGPPSEVTGDPGDPVTNTAMVLYLVQKFWNEQNVAGLDNTHGPDFISHNPVIPGNPLPYNMYKQVGLLHLAAFPDMRVTAENIMAEGDKVAVRWTVNGTHLGELMGVPPTGRPVTFTGMTIHRFADGKIIENWWAYDALGMMQQITAPPEP
ncbi:MAG: ester cyclase family protein, partial [Sedimentisphaerales bacterium]